MVTLLSFPLHGLLAHGDAWWAPCRSALDIRDISVGQGRQHFMHTISAGNRASPPMVVLPGYGAGSGFYFRNIDGLAQHFRLHCVDLLGTGMSGVGSSDCVPDHVKAFCVLWPTGPVSSCCCRNKMLP